VPHLLISIPKVSRAVVAAETDVPPVKSHTLQSMTVIDTTTTATAVATTTTASMPTVVTVPNCTGCEQASTVPTGSNNVRAVKTVDVMSLAPRQPSRTSTTNTAPNFSDTGTQIWGDTLPNVQSPSAPPLEFTR